MSESQDLSPDRLDDQIRTLYDVLTNEEESLDELFPDRHSIDSTTLELSMQRPLYEIVSNHLRMSKEMSKEMANSLDILANIPPNELLNRLRKIESGYGGSEATRRRSSRRRDKPLKQQDKPSKGVKEHPWGCQLCDRSYIREFNLRKHERAIHNIQFPSRTEKHSQKEESCSLAKAQDDGMTQSMQSNLREVSLCKTSPLQISKDELGGTPVTVGLIHRLESCLSELGSQSTKGFRIPLVIKTDGFTTNINIDVYDKSQTLPTDSGTTQLEPSLGDIKISEPEPRSEQLQLPPPPSLRQVLKVRRRRPSLAMEHDNMDAVMDQQPITTIEDSETETDELNLLMFSHSKDLTHSSSKDEAKLMGHRKSDQFVEMIKVEPSEIKAEFSEIKAEVSEIEAAFSKKRKNPDDDASHYSGVLVDSSEEENDSEGILDTTRISTKPKEMAIPVIVPKHEKVDPVRRWLYEHPDCPYPTMNEKIGLATAAGLTTQQLSCRLVNLRLRLRRELHELATYTDIDTYNTPRPKSQTLLTSSGTTQFQPCLDDVTKSDRRTILRSSTYKNLVHPSSKDKAKLMNYQGFNTTDGPGKARVSKKRENSDDDASHCSEAFSSEEGDDSDYECDNIITWNYSQQDALPSFLPYIRGYDENTSSQCSDSPESGSTTSGTTSDTPASSSASGLTGGTDLQGNGYTPPTAGTGFPDNGSSPVLGTEECRAKVAKLEPRPLICWYPAAGIACDDENHVSSSSKTRYLWR
jgi:hypothetical protein